MASAKPEMQRTGTMQATAKEGIELLKAAGKDTLLEVQGLKEPEKPVEEPKEDEVANVEDNDASDGDAPPAKKPRLSKATTMVATAKEGKALLDGEKLGETRAETTAKKEKPAVKRLTTMQKTMAEAKALIDEVPETGGRRTRSASKPKPEPKPALKKAGTMQRTAKEGKEFLKRGRKPKKVEEPIQEEEEEKEEEEEEGEEEKKEAETA